MYGVKTLKNYGKYFTQCFYYCLKLKSQLFNRFFNENSSRFAQKVKTIRVALRCGPRLNVQKVV